MKYSREKSTQIKKQIMLCNTKIKPGGKIKYIQNKPIKSIGEQY